MTIARSLVCAIATAGLLAACSKPAGPSGSSQAAASAAPASGPDVMISANDLPRPKAGEWVTTMTAQGGAPVTMRHCEKGEPVDLKSKEIAKNCSKFTFKRTFLGAYVFDAICGAGPVSMTMHTEVKGDFQGGYVSDSTGTMAMQGQPTRTISSHSEAHYAGPCTGGTE